MTTALTIRANVTGMSELSGLQRGLGGVATQSNTAATAMGRLKGAAAGAFGAIRTFLPVLGVGALAKFGKDNLDSADAMSKLSQRTGIAAPTLDKFRKVAELSDTSIESLGKGFKTLASNMYDANVKGTGPAAEAFKKLGISVTDQNGKLRDTDKVMLDVADKFKAMADGPEKAALAADIFGGKLGSELIPLLNSGGQAVRDMGTSLTQEFADKAAAFNDRLETMQEKLGDLGLRLTEAALPALEKLLQIFEGAAALFGQLPQPIQDIAAGFAAIAIPVAALAIPLGGLSTVFGTIGGLITTLGPILAGIPALLAGWAGAIGPLVAGLGTLGQVLIGVFSGPVGWVALAVAAGVAIYAFRDKIGQAFQAIGNYLTEAAKGFKMVFIDPVSNAMKGLVDGIKSLFSGLAAVLKAPFEAVANMIKGIVNGIIGGVERGINGAIRGLNRMISGANAALAQVGLPQIPFIPAVQLPRFADGGVVSGPTLAMVGEGGEPEYIVPQSKAAGFAANWMAGKRGAGAIPRFAEGGVVVPSTASVSIQTGPVTQMNGTNYVTTGDLSNAVQAGVNQTLALLAGDSRVRRSIGIA